MAIASRYWTYLELKTKVLQDGDLEGETFIQPSEMLGYCNEAIDNAEKIVKNVYPDYFLDKAPLTLVAATQEVALPDAIYAHKLRRITYRNGSEVYTIDRVRDWKKFEEYEEQAANSGSNVELRYFILNQTAGSPRITFNRPLTATDAAATVTAWFVRQANRVEEDADLLDIPEAANYVMCFMKFKCLEKEGHPGVSLAVAQLNAEEASLQADLVEMVPDGDDEIEQDKSFYGEHI